MAARWKVCCLLSLLLRLQSSTCLAQEPADRDAVSLQHGEQHGGQVRSAARPLRSLLQLTPRSDGPGRKLLQTAGAAVPFPPLKVLSNGKPCILFRARKLSIGYQNQKQLDLTNQAFSPHQPVDISGSTCHRDKATLLMRFGDVADLRGLSIRLQLSSTLYESSGQRWFSLDGVSLLYNSSEEAVFNASEVFAPAASSFHCRHVSSLTRHGGLLTPHGPHTHTWSLTFTDFQIQAFDVSSGKFSPASDCAAFLTPAILMGLVTSLILLLVLAYGLHMLVHLKHIERYEEHKAAAAAADLPRSPEPPGRRRQPDAADNHSL
ncbi:V-type proton ATPase subunit S1-like [Myripristis murdjan]|uniref:V-type proton ATPase subunit S1-like n=1 Tax=Myripristis murdjan TaxID=586833 RepID=UPI0011763E9B|nr:V-type proton ATPase subunit S1-like [Myripristis murdjan]